MAAAATSGGTIRGRADLFVGPEWHIQTTGDFDGDTKTDIFYRRADDMASIQLIDTGAVRAGATFPGPPDHWQIQDVSAFYDLDGKADLTWRNTTDGTIELWAMNGSTVRAAYDITLIGTEWVVQTHHYDLI